MTIKGSKDIASLLVYLVIPTVIVNSFCVERSAAKVVELAQSTLIAAVGIGIAMVISALIFKKDPVANFGGAFSNAGFIGIPLVQAAFGDEAVFWIVGTVALINMLQWSYGVRVITGEKSATGIRHLLMNPILVSIAIGLFLFMTNIGVQLPEVCKTTLAGISSLNAPLAMIVLGSYLAQADLRKTVTSLHLYWISTVRLLIIPAVTLAVFSFIPFRQDMILTIFIAAATPIGANVAVYAQLYDRDYPYACQTVVLTTLLSIATLPLMLMAADSFL
jgi:predicted permease